MSVWIKMANVFDVSQQELTEALAKELKKRQEFSPPAWAPFVKTGQFKQAPPLQQDWWYMRVASILRILYIRGPVGVSKLRTQYGGKKNRGMKTERTYKSSGNPIRKILQQLEQAKLAKQVEKGVHKGRDITAAGKSLIDKVARGLKKPEETKNERVRRDKEKKT